MKAALSSGRPGRRRALPWTAAAVALALLATGALPAAADLSAQRLELAQSWSNTNLISTSDDWSRVPGIVGYEGGDLTTAIGADPQAVTADGSTTAVDVSPNRGDPSGLIRGGVTEFDRIPNPVVALQPNAIADAPHLVLTVDTRMWEDVRVSYVLRDLDGSADDAVQPVALQYRVGAAGPYANLPAGFVTDATSGPGLATSTTSVDVGLPPDAANQPLVQIRILATNAVGTDEWVGVDDILVGGRSLAPGTLGFAVSRQTLDEGAGEARFEVVRTGGSNGEVTVDYSTSAGTATAGSDYTATFGTLTFADGETSQTIAVPLSDDARNEPDETFNVALFDAGGGAGLGVATATVTIVDNDVSPPPPAQQLPFSQSWSNVNLITAPDDWSRVAGMIGHSGDDLTTAIGVDPRAVTADGAATPVDVADDRGDPNGLIRGGITEFDRIPNPVVALQPNAVSDAPQLLLSLDTRGWDGATVSYRLRDIDGSADNAVQPVALQYRVGGEGPYANVPGGFVADATSGPGLATLETPVSAELPADAVGQPLVQVRFLTTNAVGTDEWVGIDDIAVVGNRAPRAEDTAATLDEDTAVELELVASDPDADALSFEIVSAPVHGTLEPLGGSRFTYRPDASYSGRDSFAFRASDGRATSNTATVSLTVLGVNDAPALSIPDVAFAEGGGAAVQLRAHWSDLETDAASAVFSVYASLFTGTVALDAATGVLRLSAADDAAGDITIAGRDDGEPPLTALDTFRATAFNVPPEIAFATTNNTALDEGGAGDVRLDYAIAEPGADSVSVAFGCGGGSLVAGSATNTRTAGTATCTYATADDATYTASARATDDDGGTGGLATQPVVVRNVAPRITSVSPQSGTAVPRGVPISVTGYFTDAGTRDLHTCSIAWGDGTSSSGTIVEAGGGGQCTALHTYTTGGVLTPRVDVTDDDGGTGFGSTTLKVL